MSTEYVKYTKSKVEPILYIPHNTHMCTRAHTHFHISSVDGTSLGITGKGPPTLPVPLVPLSQEEAGKG